MLFIPKFSHIKLLFLAVFFEEGKYLECIDQCKKAVEVGREHRADFQLVAKYFFILIFSKNSLTLRFSFFFTC